MHRALVIIASLLLLSPLSGMEEMKTFEITSEGRRIVLSESSIGLQISLYDGSQKLLSIDNITLRDDELPGVWERERTAEDFESLQERENGFSFGKVLMKSVIPPDTAG